MSLFSNPFPNWSAFTLAPIDDPGAEPIHPDELALVPPTAVDKRKREVAAGRRAAHRALIAAGIDARDPILRGPRGQPLWPAGIVGSITHAAEHAGAVVAPRIHTEGVGLDLESMGRNVGPELAKMICTPEESAWVGGDVSRLLRLFSAKEAIFKACYPVAEIYLGFFDARLVETEDGFDAEILKAFSPRHPIGWRMQIRSVVQSGMVLSATYLPPGS
jgi:4'-phosphopantetheinyl transferase EntD